MAMQVVSFRCTLKDILGRVISSTVNHNVVTFGFGKPQNLQALAEALQDLRKGEHRRICLRADQAYGFYDPSLVVVKKVSDLDMSEPVSLGDNVVYVTRGQKRSYRVTKMERGVITLDANHPLAGQDLVFEIEAMEAREATTKEISEVRESDLNESLH